MSHIWVVEEQYKGAHWEPNISEDSCKFTEREARAVMSELQAEYPDSRFRVRKYVPVEETLDYGLRRGR